MVTTVMSASWRMSDLEGAGRWERGGVWSIGSAAFPDFDCLIYASGHHIGRRLMEICEGRKKTRQHKLIYFFTKQTTAFDFQHKHNKQTFHLPYYDFHEHLMQASLKTAFTRNGFYSL